MILESKDNKVIITLENEREKDLIRVSLLESAVLEHIKDYLTEHHLPPLSEEESPTHEGVYYYLCHRAMEMERNGFIEDQTIKF